MLEELRQRYGRIVRLQMPTDDTETYLLADPAYIQQVLESNQANYRKTEIYQDELGEVFGHVLLTSEGDIGITVLCGFRYRPSQRVESRGFAA